MITCCCSSSHTICLSFDGVIYYCGDAQLGSRTEIPTQIQMLPKIQRISCGYTFSIFLDETGYMWAVGQNEGQLGIGHNSPISSPQKIESIPMIEIYCGWMHTLCITEENDLWGFGSNDFGQLCNGEQITNELAPINTKQQNIINMVAGFKFSIIQNMEKELFGCGTNLEGQFGPGTDKQIELIPLANLPRNIVSFKCGYGHCLYLDDNGKVYSIGYNLNGELGLGHNENKKEISLIPNLPKIKQITCMEDHNLLIDENNHVWIFGYNGYGGIGNGMSGINVNKPFKILNVPEIVDTSSGFGYSSWLKDINDDIWVFGNNTNGQLGINTIHSQSKVVKPTKLSEEYSYIFRGPVPQKGKSARK